MKKQTHSIPEVQERPPETWDKKYIEAGYISAQEADPYDFSG